MASRKKETLLKGSISNWLAKTPAPSKMSAQQEELPLTGGQKKAEHREQRLALGLTAFMLLTCAVSSFPPVAHRWHTIYYPTLDMEQRAWAWLSANSLWTALALIWTLFHIDNGPCVAIGCTLSTLCWAFAETVIISQAIRGQLARTAIFDVVAITTLLFLCAKATQEEAVGPSPTYRSDCRSAAWKRVLRKWVLVGASLQLLFTFVACWSTGLPLAPPESERESAPWEWNSVVILVMMLGVLWAAFLTGGEFVDETKQAACAWCALLFSGSFFLSSFSWPVLGLVGCSLTITIILALDVSVLLVAAVV